MIRTRGLFIILAVAIIILGLAVGVAQAVPPAQQGAAAGITIPYVGKLADEAGRPVDDGDYDLTFALYNAAVDGTLLWSEVQEDIAVQNGGFTAFLGRVTALPEALLADGSHWLEVAVRGPGAAAFTPLSPRQALRPALPSTQAGVNAGAPCPHDHWGESWGTTSIGVSFPGPFVALYGHSNLFAGVMGNSTNNIGVYGISSSGVGVQGKSTSYHGALFETDSAYYLDGDVALGGSVGSLVAHGSSTSELRLSARGDVTIKMDADNNGTHTFQVKNGLDFSVCWIEENGNLTCSGTKSAVVDTQDTGWRQLYAVESPEVWHEDLGTAVLVDGEVTIPFEPIYARTVNLEADYHVFVTPLSAEPVWLYVTAKSTSGFTVRGVTLDGQPAACALDYRVMAKRLGYEDVRLAPFAPAEVGR